LGLWGIGFFPAKYSPIGLIWWGVPSPILKLLGYIKFNLNLVPPERKPNFLGGSIPVKKTISGFPLGYSPFIFAKGRFTGPISFSLEKANTLIFHKTKVWFFPGPRGFLSNLSGSLIGKPHSFWGQHFTIPFFLKRRFSQASYCQWAPWVIGNFFIKFHRLFEHKFSGP